MPCRMVIRERGCKLYCNNESSNSASWMPATFRICAALQLVLIVFVYLIPCPFSMLLSNFCFVQLYNQVESESFRQLI